MGDRSLRPVQQDLSKQPTVKCSKALKGLDWGSTHSTRHNGGLESNRKHLVLKRKSKLQAMKPWATPIILANSMKEVTKQ